MFRHTIPVFRRAQVTIPTLSPTHTKAKITKWFTVGERKKEGKNVEVECYDPIFVLECSPDMVTEGYRKHETHQPLMIVESHDEGVLRLRDDLKLDTWYDVGEPLGEIDDGDDDEAYDGDWLWQAYSYDEQEETMTTEATTMTHSKERGQ